jgi:hypothetical protein
MLDAASVSSEQKSRQICIFRLSRLVEPANFTVLGHIINFCQEPVKRKQTRENTGENLGWLRKNTVLRVPRLPFSPEHISWERWRLAGEFCLSVSDWPAGRQRSQEIHERWRRDRIF